MHSIALASRRAAVSSSIKCPTQITRLPTRTPLLIFCTTARYLACAGVHAGSSPSACAGSLRVCTVTHGRQCSLLEWRWPRRALPWHIAVDSREGRCAQACTDAYAAAGRQGHTIPCCTPGCRPGAEVPACIPSFSCWHVGNATPQKHTTDIISNTQTNHTDGHAGLAVTQQRAHCHQPWALMLVRAL